jgi:hypothetical protein
MRRLLVLLPLAGCGGVDPEDGLGAWLRVEGAQYQAGELPGESGGPAVASLFVADPTIRPGEVGKAIEGALGETAGGAVFRLAGDAGFWTVVAGIPGATTPDLPSANLTASFAADLPLGRHELQARAFDAEGRGGPLATLELTALAGPAVTGELVISLSWDRNADLDLHVVDPNGVEIHKGNINSWSPPPPGEPVDPEAWKTGALLDFDSNAQCVIDGRRQENVIWAMEPPSGRYIVRVDTFSLCGEPGAYWNVDVILRGALVAGAIGISTPIDATANHLPGAGQLALEVDVP